MSSFQDLEPSDFAECREEIVWDGHLIFKNPTTIPLCRSLSFSSPLSYNSPSSRATITSFSTPSNAPSAVPSWTFSLDSEDESTPSFTKPSGGSAVPDFLCPDCGFKAATKSLLRKHKKTHHGFWCEHPGCSKSYSTKGWLERHTRIKHCAVESQKYQCSVGSCELRDNVWIHKDSFIEHLKRVHQKDIHSAQNLEPFIRTLGNNPSASHSTTFTTSNPIGSVASPCEPKLDDSEAVQNKIPVAIGESPNLGGAEVDSLDTADAGTAPQSFEEAFSQKTPDTTVRVASWAKEVCLHPLGLRSPEGPTQSATSPSSRGNSASVLLFGDSAHGGLSPYTDQTSEQSDIFDDSGSIFCPDRMDEYPSWDPSGSQIAEVKQAYLDLTIGAIFDRLTKLGCLGVKTTSAGSNSSHSKKEAGGSAAVSVSQGHNRNGKRTSDQTSWGNSGAGNTGNGGDDDEDDTRPTKIVKPSPSMPHRRRLACPFYKRHPDKFRSCGLADHENTSRVKQHLTRRHVCPIYCSKCFREFDREDHRDFHVRQNTCSNLPPVEFICASRDQIEKLRKRHTSKTDRENWNAVFKILFPNDPLPASPYLDVTISEDVNFVRELFLAEAPAALDEAISRSMPEELRTLYRDEIAQSVATANLGIFERAYEMLRSSRHRWRGSLAASQAASAGPSDTPSCQGFSSRDSGIGSGTFTSSSSSEASARLPRRVAGSFGESVCPTPSMPAREPRQAPNTCAAPLPPPHPLPADPLPGDLPTAPGPSPLTLTAQPDAVSEQAMPALVEGTNPDFFSSDSLNFPDAGQEEELQAEFMAYVGNLFDIEEELGSSLMTAGECTSHPSH